MPSPHPRISARLSAIAESATLAVDAKAKALKAAGRPVIGFGAGEPDFPTPGYIVEAAQRACAEPRFHKYTPAAGLPIGLALSGWWEFEGMHPILPARA